MFICFLYFYFPIRLLQSNLLRAPFQLYHDFIHLNMPLISSKLSKLLKYMLFLHGTRIDNIMLYNIYYIKNNTNPLFKALWIMLEKSVGDKKETKKRYWNLSAPLPYRNNVITGCISRRRFYVRAPIPYRNNVI